MNTTIASIASLPDKCPIQEIQGKVTAVYELKQVNGKNKQNFVLADASGNSVMVGAWEHPDLSCYKDKEVIICAGPKGGLAVNVYNNKAGINLSRTCTLQYLQVHQAQSSGGAAPVVGVAGAAQAPTAPAQRTVVVNGAKVGMAINGAIAFMVEKGEDFNHARIRQLASDIIRVSNDLENGDILPLSELPPF